jgi:hypothetical protein
MNAFMLQALSDALLPFPQLEKIMGPFRSAILNHLNVDSQTDFEKLVKFIHALSLQMWRCNYLWEIKEEDKEGLVTLKKMLEKELKVTEELPRALYQKLSIYALYYPLSDLDGIEDWALNLGNALLVTNNDFFFKI